MESVSPFLRSLLASANSVAKSLPSLVFDVLVEDVVEAALAVVDAALAALTLSIVPVVGRKPAGS